MQLGVCLAIPFDLSRRVLVAPFCDDEGGGSHAKPQKGEKTEEDEALPNVGLVVYHKGFFDRDLDLYDSPNITDLPI